MQRAVVPNEFEWSCVGKIYPKYIIGLAYTSISGMLYLKRPKCEVECRKAWLCSEALEKHIVTPLRRRRHRLVRHV